MEPETTDRATPSRRERLLQFVRERRGPLAVYLKGFAMGAADTVPGVSGGTIALIVGIYDRFIRALTLLDPRVLLLFRRVHRADGRTEFRQRLVEMEVPFLTLLFAGLLSAVFTIARVIHVALESAPGPTFAFFGGLIAASAVVLADRRWVSKWRDVAAAVAGFLVAFVVAGASGTGLLPTTLPMIFLSATIAISGMVLPGISGSFLLLLLGQFEYMTGVVTSFGDGVVTLLTGGTPENLVSDAAVLGVFALGAAVGFFTVAYAVRSALERYPSTTFVFLVSLMVGALRYPVIRVVETTDAAAVPVAGVALTAVVGGALVLVLDRYTDDLGYDEYV
jgi:putative membrane protein